MRGGLAERVNRPGGFGGIGSYPNSWPAPHPSESTSISTPSFIYIYVDIRQPTYDMHVMLLCPSCVLTATRGHNRKGSLHAPCRAGCTNPPRRRRICIRQRVDSTCSRVVPVRSIGAVHDSAPAQRQASGVLTQRAFSTATTASRCTMNEACQVERAQEHSRVRLSGGK